MIYLTAQNDWQVSNYSRQLSTKIHASIYTTTTCAAKFLVQPNTNKLIFNNSPNKYKWNKRVLSSKETESSTQDTYKNLELTAKIAARQEYSTGISEAQEYSKWKSGACLSPTQEC